MIHLLIHHGLQTALLLKYISYDNCQKRVSYCYCVLKIVENAVNGSISSIVTWMLLVSLQLVQRIELH